jgi:hypothetical protein
LYNFQVLPETLEEKEIPSAKKSEKTKVPSKAKLFQMVIIPPEAPREGTNKTYQISGGRMS